MVLLPSIELTMLMITYGLEGSWRPGGGSSWSASNPVGGVPRRHGPRQAHVHPQPRVSVLLSVDLRETIEPARRGVLGVRDKDLHPLPLGGYDVVDRL